MMNQRAQGGMPINTIGIIIMMVLVVVTVSFFFFNGLNQQGGVMSKTSDTTVSGIDSKLNANIACLPPIDINDDCCGVGESPNTNGCCCQGICANQGGC